MSSIEAIIAGFVTTLGPINGLRATGDEDNFNPPAVIIRNTGRQAASMNRAVQTATFALIVCVKANTPIKNARQAINDYLSDRGADSIEARLLADPTLNETVDDILDISVEPGQAWGTAEIGGVPYPSGVLNVEVIF